MNDIPIVSPSRNLLALLSVAAGVAVANLYYAQPLAASMANSFGVAPATLGSALVATQIGYALGMVLLVPLGDGRERRRIIVTTVSSAVPALLVLAFAPNVTVLVLSSLLVGVVSSVPQMILPYAVTLAPSEDRGRVVGSVMTGLLVGILLSRTVSGTLGEWLGWRTMFLLAAICMLLLAGILRLAIPAQEPPSRLGWSETIRSLWTVWRTQPILRRRAWIGGLGFASFSVFWSTLSFHLANIGYGSAMAGTFGIIGIAGVLVGPIAARHATGTHVSRINVIALLTLASAFVLFVIEPRSLGVLGAGVVLLDAGAQASHLTNQTVIFGLTPELRSRINALYMVGFFTGGSLGTAIASAMWSFGGWTAACVAGGVLALGAMLPLIGER